ncbi:GNAT family N-acetyltransferase [Copranaerobaculum intestinale]|uniref:GNAT family N-acetyltransferase n=1 Tax=Copranaerobaculum intestinale TaxID=2692629 RepID=UPI00201BAD5A|nr:GNAT family N-acetyltransferase [Copranaerobaculum intestinale]
MHVILETSRLMLREMTMRDTKAIASILQDEQTMYAYEHAFSDQEVKDWITHQIIRYQKDGFGLWAVVLKETGEVIGQCGITMQKIPGKEVPEIGYLLNRNHWHQGFAIEAASACRIYAFKQLEFDEVYSIIRENNIASRNVALNNSMEVRGKFTKHYYDIEMPHLIYSARKKDFIKNA